MSAVGGPGLATAIFARRCNPALSVVLLKQREGLAPDPRQRRVAPQPHQLCRQRARYWGGRSTIVRRVLRAFPVPETVAFFRELGVHVHEEADGKLFPDSNRAREVLDARIAAVDRAGARLLANRRVHDIAPVGSGFQLTTSGASLHAKAVVLATGGQSLPKSGSDGAGFAFARRLGHTIVPTTPGLVPSCWKAIFMWDLPEFHIRRTDDLDRRRGRDAAEGRPPLDAHRCERAPLR